MPQATPDVLRELGIGFDGRQYRFLGHRYDRVEDAVAQARLLAERPDLRAEEDPQAAGWPVGTPAEPTDDERREMAAEGIGFVQGRYTLGPYRYERLSDALAYARCAAPTDRPSAAGEDPR